MRQSRFTDLYEANYHRVLGYARRRTNPDDARAKLVALLHPRILPVLRRAANISTRAARPAAAS